MEIFIGIVFIIVKLISESIQEKKANDYANMVVRRYPNRNGGSKS